jgi:hypothetical protein
MFGVFDGVDPKDTLDEREYLTYGVCEPARTEATGLLKPLARITSLGVTYHILRHPDLFQLDHIDAWLHNYDYTNEYKVPIDEDDRHPCWLDLRDEFKSVHSNLMAKLRAKNGS